jgi:hypothetical protein
MPATPYVLPPDLGDESHLGLPTQRAQVLDGCLGWLSGQLSWFRPSTWDAHFPSREIPGQTVLELLLLCRMLARGSQAQQQHPLLAGAHEVAAAVCADPDFEVQLTRVDAQFPYLVWLLALTGDFGPETDSRRAQVQRILDLHGPGVVGLDWPPTPTVELSYILGLGEFRVDVPGFGEVLGENAYAHADPIRLEEPDAYAITHVLLYATDLGARPLPVAGPARARLTELLLTVLGTQLVAGQLDLSAELLHCLHALDPTGGAAEHRLVRLAWERLAAAQLPNGAVPGPPYSPEIAAQRPAEELDAYLFRACYHTTIVAAMAAVAGEQLP